MLNGVNLYALEKFSSAVYILATGPNDVRSRLLTVFNGPLLMIEPDHLPEKLQDDYKWIRRSITKYDEYYKGQLNELREKENLPNFKETCSHLYPTPVEATLSRIINKTGTEIARRIYNIHDTLESMSSK